ncbi:hypothetical protein MLD38_024357 [Melastoma candidum]|uniref:Uncharacterized protein n=1 Tax=Melastoma candidum TaxID=119954 RepID=A0ACB9NYS8_9MYRT|nr:hypothetical protein MLD38_024357 [Melastoma candidum]
MRDTLPDELHPLAADLGDDAGVCTRGFPRGCGRPWRLCWSLHQGILAELRPTLATMLEFAPEDSRGTAADLGEDVGVGSRGVSAGFLLTLTGEGRSTREDEWEEGLQDVRWWMRGRSGVEGGRLRAGRGGTIPQKKIVATDSVFVLFLFLLLPRSPKKIFFLYVA